MHSSKGVKRAKERIKFLKASLVELRRNLDGILEREVLLGTELFRLENWLKARRKDERLPEQAL